MAHAQSCPSSHIPANCSVTVDFGKGGNTSDAWLLKLNKNGTIAWDASLGGTGNDEFHAIIQLEDGTYVSAGEFGADDL
jgi:hypothetical protein